MTRPIALAVLRKRGLGAPSASDIRAGGETAEFSRRRLRSTSSSPGRSPFLGARNHEL